MALPLNDTFTGTDGTNAASHTSDSGGTYFQPAHGNTGQCFINSNRVTKDGDSSQAIVLTNETVGANCRVRLKIRMLTSISVNVAAVGRAASGSDDYVWCRHNRDSNAFQLRETIGSAASQLASVSETLVANDERTIEIQFFGSAARVLIDGVERIPPTAITATAGTAGYRFGGAASSTTGYAADDLFVENISGWTVNPSGIASGQAFGTPTVSVGSQQTVTPSGIGSAEAFGTATVARMPVAPMGLLVHAPLPGKVVLGWIDRATTETSFRVERKTGAGGAYVEIGSASSNDQEFEDTTVSANTIYFYRVKARDSAGDSSYAPEKQVTTPALGVTRLRILSWNIQFCKGTDDVQDNERTATWLFHSRADLMALCEAPEEEVADLVSRLETKSGVIWHAHHVGKTPGLSEGNLILSRFPFVSTDEEFLTDSRSVAEATVQVNGRTVNFFATHLDASATDDIRIAQTNQLQSYADGFGEIRIVAGDFNGDGPDEAHIVDMVATYHDAWDDARVAGTAFAYPDNPVGVNTRTRRNRLDYIFLSRVAVYITPEFAEIPDGRDLLNADVVVLLGNSDDDGVRPSDHNLFVADLELPTLISPSGIASAVTFGTPLIKLTVTPAGIGSAEAFGAATVSPGAVTVSPVSITSAEDFGTAGLRLQLRAASIVSAEAFGTPIVSAAANTIAPVAIGSSESFGTPTVQRSGVVISVAAIVSAEAFGSAIVGRRRLRALPKDTLTVRESENELRVTHSSTTLKVAID